MLSTLPNQKSILRRQIPTILGLGVLVVALVAGILFFGQGFSGFAPRATPQTTPKLIKVSNVTDNSFTVSFLTDESTPGFIKYGTAADKLESQASDDRDQLSGSVGSFSLHHITVRGLQPNTQYFYTLGTGSNASFDNQGSPFALKTAQRAGTPAAAKTIYGNILNESGGPAEGSIVYITLDGVGEMSSLVKGSGSWAVPLSNARKADGSGYAEVTDDAALNILVQGPKAIQKSQVTATVATAQPVSAITLGQDGTAEADIEEENGDEIATKEETDETTDDSTLAEAASATGLGGTATQAASMSASPTPVATASARATATSSAQLATTATASATVIDLQKTSAQTVTTSQPIIKGKAAPNVVVNITVNSETHIVQQLTTNANGEFILDISQLENELEPGEHSVEYSYVDPATGKTITKTQNFTVKASTSNQLASTAIAAVSPSPVPYGSGNPVPIGGATSSATATKSAVATKSATATTSARTSQPATGSGIPVSGSVGTTLALIIGGLFFTLTGAWSYWVSQQLHAREEE